VTGPQEITGHLEEARSLEEDGNQGKEDKQKGEKKKSSQEPKWVLETWQLGREQDPP